MFLQKLFSAFKKTPPIPPVFSLPENVRVYAVGDIHGKADILKKTLAMIKQDAEQHPNKKIIEVFLGDYIDRGLESKQVVDMLLEPSSHQRIFLKGNHEETLLRFLEDPQILRDWGNYGGFATLDSYGVPMPKTMSPEKLNILCDVFISNVPEAHMHFFKNLQLMHQIGNYLFVHAGISPELPMDMQKPEHLLWIRTPFLRHKDFFEHYIVHGHSPVTAPDIKHNRANLDISTAEKESLCCLILEGTDRQVFVVS